MKAKSQTPLSVSMIVIGDEILNGRTTDLNGSWLSKFLFKKGLQFKSLRFIHDDIIEMNKALADSMSESDIVITSGGIGPTFDDKTKSILASFFNKKIIERDDVANIVTQNYLQFGRQWSPSYNHYHFFPEDFIATNNPKGLAPGLAYFDAGANKLILSGPGVPGEFSVMVEVEFLKLIESFFPERFKENFQTVIRTKGVPEEKIFFELCPSLWSELEVFGKVSSLPQTIGIDIVISYLGNQKIHEEKERTIKKLIEESKLGPYVWQYGNLSINELVLAYAKEKKLKFAFAESCTGGLVSSKMTDLAGSSEVFMGSVVSYSNEAKMQLLGVKSETLKSFGAVSQETAKEMAYSAREKFNCDFAVSISGIAGPSGGSIEKPVGTVTIGYAGKNINGAKSFIFPGDRIRKKERFSDMALLILFDLMKGNLVVE